MGMSQLSLTKCIVLVSEGVDVRDFSAVLRELGRNYDPQFDFVMIPRVPLDTLDFTSATMNLGSKMILDATVKDRPPAARKHPRKGIPPLRAIDRRIAGHVILDETMLVVAVHGEGKPVLKKLLAHPALGEFPLVVTVSEDVDLLDRENTLWGIFTRFDCERDVVFARQKLVGACAVYGGAMGIDATWKRGYPAPLAMTEEILAKVEERWDAYWR
jgi:4-hydroxy-3-polyprenylbenzoate decarboxylase